MMVIIITTVIIMIIITIREIITVTVTEISKIKLIKKGLIRTGKWNNMIYLCYFVIVLCHYTKNLNKI